MGSRTLNIVFSEDLFHKMDEAAKSQYISWSAFVRLAVAEKLNREQKAAENKTLDWQMLLNDQN